MKKLLEGWSVVDGSGCVLSVLYSDRERAEDQSSAWPGSRVVHLLEVEE